MNSFVHKSDKKNMANKKFQIGFWTISFILSSTSSILIYQYLCRAILCKFTLTLLTFQILATWTLLQSMVASDPLAKFPSMPFVFKLLLSSLIFLTFYSQMETLKFASSELYSLFCSILILTSKFASKGDFASIFIALPTLYLAKNEIDFNSSGFRFGLLFIASAAAMTNLFELSCRKYNVGSINILITLLPYTFIISLVFATLFESKSFQTNQFSLMGMSFIVLSAFVSVCTNGTFFTSINCASAKTVHVCETVSSFILIFVAPLIFGGFNKITNAELIRKSIAIGISLVFIGIYVSNRYKSLPSDHEHKEEPLLDTEDNNFDKSQ